MRPAGTGSRFDISAYASSALSGRAPERFVALALAAESEPPLLATANHEP